MMALAMFASSCSVEFGTDDGAIDTDETTIDAGSADNGEQTEQPADDGSGGAGSADDGAADGADTDDADAGDGSDDTDSGGGDGAAPASSPSSQLISDPDASVPETLTAGLTQPELRNLLVDVHGPTEDVAAELSRVGIFPDDIPTATGSDIYDFTITTTVKDELNSHVKTEVRMFIPAEPADAAVFFESSLVAAGYDLVGTGTETRDEVEVKTFEFDVDNTETNLSFGLDIALFDGDFDGTIVSLEHYDALDEAQWPQAREQMDALRAWNGNTPIPAGGVQTGLVLQSNINNSVFSFHWLNVTERWAFEGQSGEDVAAAIIDNMASSDYEFRLLDGDPEPAEALRLAGEERPGFLGFGLRRNGEFNGPRITIWDVYNDKPDSSIDFTGGSTDALGNYTSYE